MPPQRGVRSRLARAPCMVRTLREAAQRVSASKRSIRRVGSEPSLPPQRGSSDATKVGKPAYPPWPRSACPGGAGKGAVPPVTPNCKTSRRERREVASLWPVNGPQGFSRDRHAVASLHPAAEVP